MPTHEENRASLCVFLHDGDLFKGSAKNGMRTISNDSSYANQIRKYTDLTSYDTDDLKSLIGICSKHRKNLYDIDKQELDEKKAELMQKLDPTFNDLQLSFPNTSRIMKEDKNCECSFCVKSKAYCGTKGNIFAKKFKPGRFPSRPAPPPPELRCPNCQTIIGKGKKHKCTLTEKRKNITAEVAKDPDLQEHITANTISQKLKEAKIAAASAMAAASSNAAAGEGTSRGTGSSSPSKLSQLAQFGKANIVKMKTRAPGKQLTVQVQTPSQVQYSLDPPQMTADDYMKMMVARDFTTNDVRFLAKVERKKHGRRSVESNLMENLRKNIGALVDFFTHGKFEVDPCGGSEAGAGDGGNQAGYLPGKVLRTVVYCNKVCKIFLLFIAGKYIWIFLNCKHSTTECLLFLGNKF